MRKGVIWTGAIVGALLAAGGWIFEFALSKGAAFIYAVVVSLIANAVFDYVHEPDAPPPAKAATAVIRPADAARQTSAAKSKMPATGPAAGVQAALPAAARRPLPAIISPVPVHPLPPPAPPPAAVAAGSQPAANPPPPPQQQAAQPPPPAAASPPLPQQTALAIPPAAAPAAAPLAPPSLAPPPAPAAAPAPAQPPAAPGPGSGGLY